jgi:hypothetical protein
MQAVQLVGDSGSQANASAVHNSVAMALNIASACPGWERTHPRRPRASSGRSIGSGGATVTATRSKRSPSQQIFVAPTGSDATGTGSQEAPFASLARAQVAARMIGRGATVVVRGGV